MSGAVSAKLPLSKSLAAVPDCVLEMSVIEDTDTEAASAPDIVQPVGGLESDMRTASENPTVISLRSVASADTMRGAMPSDTGMFWRLASGLSCATGNVRYCETALRCRGGPCCTGNVVLSDALSAMSPEPDPASAPTSAPEVS